MITVGGGGNGGAGGGGEGVGCDKTTTSVAGAALTGTTLPAGDSLVLPGTRFCRAT